ncbi:MAG: hypothetical protein PHP73_07265 [Candidatus Omnitrophica bacterium]|nr:hypothetical protein [Candidatus Omnitrophota bacterium]
MSTAFAIKILGLFLGVVARSLIPFLRKLRQGTVKRFDRRYLYSALGTFLLGIVITMVIFPQFKADAPGAGFEAYFQLFCLAFSFGFGWNAIVFEAGKWADWFVSEESLPTTTAEQVSNSDHAPDRGKGQDQGQDRRRGEDQGRNQGHKSGG